MRFLIFIPLLFLFLLAPILAFATDIVLTWDTPTEREDGSKIEQIDRFNLYTTRDNILQDTVEISADATNFQLSEVEAGTYTFQISPVEDGLECALSDPVSVNIDEKVIAKVGKVRITVEVVE